MMSPRPAPLNFVATQKLTVKAPVPKAPGALPKLTSAWRSHSAVGSRAIPPEPSKLGHRNAELPSVPFDVPAESTTAVPLGSSKGQWWPMPVGGLAGDPTGAACPVAGLQTPAAWQVSLGAQSTPAHRSTVAAAWTEPSSGAESSSGSAPLQPAA